MRSRFFAATLALTGALHFCAFSPDARANTTGAIGTTGTIQDEADALLWRNGVPRAKPLSQKEFADAASGQISLLKELRGWRESLRSNGAARREIAGTNLLGYGAGLSLGASAPTQSGIATSGVAAHWGRVEIGSTLRSNHLSSALSSFDRAMSGQKSGQAEPARALWLRAKPWESGRNFVELTALQSARDTQTGKGEAWKRGRFFGSRAQLALPANWLATGEITRAQVEEGQARDSWKTGLSGPLAHPFGVAQAQISLGQTDAGFENLALQNTDGAREGAASLAQKVALGPLEGQIQVAGQNRRRDDFETALESEILRSKSAQTQADLKLRLTPNLSVNATGKVLAAQNDKALGEALEEMPTTREETQTWNGDLGLEWRFSRSLKLGASLGAGEVESWRREGEEFWNDLPGHEENRGAIELRHQTGGGALAVRYGRRERENGSDQSQTWRDLETLRLEAERRLIGTFRVRTIFDFARDRGGLWSDEDSLARSAQAQLSLNRATRLDLKIRDGAALPSSLLGESIGNPFAALSEGEFQTGDRQFAARFNAGSAASGKGLGLAFEYARHTRSGPDVDSWKVGVTFR